MSRVSLSPSRKKSPVIRYLAELWEGLRDGEPPDSWNALLVRELRRGSWREGIIPRVVVFQIFCFLAWSQEGAWSLFPVVAALLTALLEARCAAADHRSRQWEFVRVTGGSDELWWRGWKGLHFINLVAALSTLAPWFFIVWDTQESLLSNFLWSWFLAFPSSCLAFRRWTAPGLIATVWKRWLSWLGVLLGLEVFASIGVIVLASLPSNLLGFQLMVLLFIVGPLFQSLYLGGWCRLWVRDSPEQPKGDGWRQICFLLGVILGAGMVWPLLEASTIFIFAVAMPLIVMVVFETKVSEKVSRRRRLTFGLERQPTRDCLYLKDGGQEPGTN